MLAQKRTIFIIKSCYPLKKRKRYQTSNKFSVVRLDRDKLNANKIMQQK